MFNAAMGTLLILSICNDYNSRSWESGDDLPEMPKYLVLVDR